MKLNLWLGLVLAVFFTTGCPPAQHEDSPKRNDDFQKAKTVIIPLSSYGYLRKLSLHLRGTLPSQNEYKVLAEALSENAQGFYLKQKVKEYLATPNHVFKMEDRLSELFSLLPETDPWETDSNDNPFRSSFKNNSLNILFRDLVKKNKSWDELLTGKQYSIHPLKGFSLSIGDRLFYAHVAADQLVEPTYDERGIETTPPQHIEFNKQDLRVAGAVTTGRFFDRYVTTALNKNRKRAAAIFKIFLCDDMRASLPEPTENLDPIYDLIFPETESQSGEPLPKLTEDVHGSHPDCKKCHYKLDPMGRNFEFSSAILSRFPSSGALTYQDKNGSMVDISTKGLGDLAFSITQQEEYAECQVRHFWNWFIGSDVPLQGDRLREVITQFEKVERKTNDFISYLVSTDEFWSTGETMEEDNLRQRSL
ncbi:MAG: DUF1588 domain-containing protein, partial [Bdellovibrionales bacterium]|nr:DUF1588 domain-containing protein [Bdellovibrionales bacterium]